MSKPVRFFVEPVAAVAAHPLPGDRSLIIQGVELPPKIGVADRLLVRFPPALRLPSGKPFRHAFDQVLAVRADREGVVGPQEGEGVDGRLKLHPVVRGLRRTARHTLRLGDLLPFPKLEDCPPTSLSGVAYTSAVCVDDDVAKRGSGGVFSHWSFGFLSLWCGPLATDRPALSRKS